MTVLLLGFVIAKQIQVELFHLTRVRRATGRTARTAVRILGKRISEMNLAATLRSNPFTLLREPRDEPWITQSMLQCRMNSLQSIAAA